MDTPTKAVAAVLAFFCPPIAVILAKGSTSHILISVLLTLFFWVPGVVHALYMVFREDIKLDVE